MLVTTFLSLADIAADLVAGEEVRGRWDDASALDGYTVAALAGHLSRAVLTASRSLDTPGAPPETAVTAAQYFVEVLADHDPVDSDFHAAVRARAAEAAGEGPEALAASIRTARRVLAGRLADLDLDRHHVAVLDGVTLPLGEYLKTRLVELVVHLDDLGVSIGREPEIPDTAFCIVASVLGELAAARAGGLATVRSLARRERHPAPVRAL